MEVSIVTRVDFPDKFLTEKLKRFFLSPDAESINTEFFNQERFDILECLADIHLPSCRGIGATSLLLEWDNLGNDWETVYETTVRSLRKLDSIMEVSVVSGDDGWYQLFTQVLDESNSLDSWEDKDLNQIFDRLSNFVPIIDKVNKALVKEHKAKISNFTKKYLKQKKNLKPHAAVKSKRKSKYLPDIDEPEYFAKHWHPDNKEWMEQRIKDWRPFADRLERLRKKNKQAFKFHMEIFFQGTFKGYDVFIDGDINPDMNDDHALRLRRLLGTGLWPLYFIYYHPNPENINLEKFRLSATKGSTWEDLRKTGLNGRWISPCNFLDHFGSVLDDSYAQRVVLLMQFLFPSYKNDETFTSPARRGSDAKICSIGTQHLGLSLLRVCDSATSRELSTGKWFESYRLGQFMWDHLSYAMQNYPEDMHHNLATEHRNRDIDNLSRTIAEILNFKNRTDDSRNRPSTVAMVDRLISKYESKEFSKPMLELWDSAKENLDELLKEEFRV